MKFHKEGYASIIVVTIFSIILIGLVHLYAPYVWLKYLSYAVSGFLIITILQFFRSPKRNLKVDENLIIAPADGKVVVMEEVMETEYFNEKRKQVSIFMSPINVHLNRYPIGGIMKYVKYHPGKYLVAWHPKSSTENERTTLVVEHKNGKEVLFRQIAGALARRIVHYCEVDATVNQGEECGFIKFGSRVDLLLPLDAKILVELEQKVTGGETVIAAFN